MTREEEIVEETLDKESPGQEQGDMEEAREAGEASPTTDETDELAKARKEVSELQDKILRLAAEFENYKKRMERDRGLALKYAEEAILKELLPSIDNLERAIEQGRQTHNVADLLTGVELTHKGILSTLEKFEVAPMESIGLPFDPNFHEALAMEECDDVDPNCVAREFQKGYTFKDKLLRPAKVVVAKKNETSEED